MARVASVTAAPAIRAAGGVLWRAVGPETNHGGGVEVAVIHRPRYDDWSLPKGKLASGESDLDGAVREVLEETGYHVRVGRSLGVSTYQKETRDGPRPKVVRWWAMEAEAGAFSVTLEVDRLEWLTLADAAARLTRPTDRDVLERFARGARPTRSLLLVRHASAAPRTGWRGTDAQRPLDACGVAQADELIRGLSRYAVGQLISSDARRCVETIQPFADAFGLELEVDRLVSEAGYPGHETEVVATLRRLGDGGHDAVVVSHGDVIADLVARLATEDGYPMPADPSLDKGSAWALTMDVEDRLVEAVRIEAPRPEACRGRNLS